MATQQPVPSLVLAIRAQMLRGGEPGDALLAHRDGGDCKLAIRARHCNQEVWGLRWSSIDAHFAWVTEVISYGRLEHWGKTAMSTRRHTAIPSILREDPSTVAPSSRGRRPLGPRHGLHHSWGPHRR